jgi:hypothetical protein
MRVWIQLLVVTAMLLAVANGQCLARCGTELCDSTHPASHCHEDTDSTPVASCAHPHFALPNGVATAQVTLAAAGMVMPSVIAVAVLNPTQQSAPNIASPRLSVLKI